MNQLSDYDFELPDDRIAQVPLADRAASRLLWLHRESGLTEHRSFREVPQILRPGDLLVVNDTRVSAVRVKGHKATGGAVEALLLHEVAHGTYEAMVKPGRRLPDGTRIELAGMAATVEGRGGIRIVRFDPSPDLKVRLAEAGETPLPPYIHERLPDAERYQTSYAREEGSAAAPTAGLHFTAEIIEDLRARGIEVARVTLHVGIDTFKPLQTENLDEHQMHGEVCEVPTATAEALSRCTGRIVAVGTTTVRTLESFATGPRKIRPGRMRSSLFIRPGFEFQIVDGMFTNFHLPRTTMLAMISALAGYDEVRRAYAAAIEERYRFLSFGDSMLIL
ncbi:tRNA preQ1(34) S-adenosylmethionine ribosyltransferase-isomerase QueA [bacterium]|nr:MAG: tRNA preQ1(34) S-adenosylmethionine ribosyltransferase-isomerase QueA [bacterium]